MTRSKTKAAIAAEARAIGVPSDRLNGTRPQLEIELESYATALAEAGADTAAAAFPVDVTDDLALFADSLDKTPKRIDPGHAAAAAVLLAAGAKAMGWL
ncbi:MAG: hypothetical protein HC824_11335 [Synechococcales cyanobacterium RM1_1_8]|nr:hypothetical protein [Synechococcales cyanobacterium RM1_1_8]